MAACGGEPSILCLSFIIAAIKNIATARILMLKIILHRIVIAAMALLIMIQFVPYGRKHSNPPISAEPRWDTAETRALAKRACFDCHSHETAWPWYSHVAPISWLVQNDVTEGRRKLNFSTWDGPQKEADEAVEQIQKGEMPLWFYLPLHASARLSTEEKQALIRGLQATIGNDTHHELGEFDEDSVTEENAH